MGSMLSVPDINRRGRLPAIVPVMRYAKMMHLPVLTAREVRAPLTTLDIPCRVVVVLSSVTNGNILYVGGQNMNIVAGGGGGPAYSNCFELDPGRGTIFEAHESQPADLIASVDGLQSRVEVIGLRDIFIQCAPIGAGLTALVAVSYIQWSL
jgi:hypothetical protein